MTFMGEIQLKVKIALQDTAIALHLNNKSVNFDT
jgi:hypothetical protein